MLTSAARSLVVEDAAADPNFADRATTYALGIGAYSGVPLHHEDGTLYGTLCLLDQQRRTTEPGESALLMLAGRLIMQAVDADRRQHQVLRQTKAHLDAVIRNAPVLSWSVDTCGILTRAEGKALEILGVTADQVVGQSIFAIYRNVPAVERATRCALRGEMVVELSATRQRSYETTYIPVRSEDGTVVGVNGISTDVTERERAAVALQASEERFRRVAQSATDAIVAADAQGHIVFWNDGARATFGYDEAEVMGRPLTLLMPERYHPPHLAGMERMRTAGHAALSRKALEVEGIRKDGTVFPLELSISHWTENGNVFVGGIMRDITERKEADARLRYQALHDGLTGLPNRTLLYDRLDQEIRTARRGNGHVALLVLDLNRFKDINDAFGHQHGDLLLREVATRITSTLRSSDTVARLGGDEFAMLLPDTDEMAAAMVVHKVLDALAQPLDVADHSFPVDASIGIALYPDHGQSADILLRRADAAMYLAKHGNIGYATYEPDQDHHAADRLSLLTDLRRAIERKDLSLHYQPKLNLSTGKVTGVEALVRWQHPSRGFVPPARFIPLAERTGLIKALSEWVLTEAVEQCARWHDAGIHISVAVNLSTRNLHDPQLTGTISGLLAACHLDPQWLKIEVTESAVMTDPFRAIDTLKRLRAVGIEISVDDFGTGYSSLAYLKRLPVNELKIDQSFIRDLLNSPEDNRIVQATIDLAHDLALNTVAEGVEDDRTARRLTELGCDHMQGYYLSRPLPVDECTAWLLEQLPGDSRQTATQRYSAIG